MRRVYVRFQNIASEIAITWWDNRPAEKLHYWKSLHSARFLLGLNIQPRREKCPEAKNRAILFHSRQMQSNHCRILKYGPLGLLKIVSISANGKVKNCMNVQIPFRIYCGHDCDILNNLILPTQIKHQKVKAESDWFKQFDTYPWASDLPAMR